MKTCNLLLMCIFIALTSCKEEPANETKNTSKHFLEIPHLEVIKTEKGVSLELQANDKTVARIIPVAPVQKDKPTWEIELSENSSAPHPEIIVKSGDPENGLAIVHTFQSFEGHGVVNMRSHIRNTSDDPVRLDGGEIAKLVFTQQGSGYTHYWIEKGAGKPTDVGIHINRAEPGYSFSELSTPYAKGKIEPIPWQCLINQKEKTGLWMAAEASSQISLFCEASRGNLSMGMGMDTSMGKYDLTELAPGGRYEFPVLYFGLFEGSLDDGCNKMKKWMVEELLATAPEGTILPLLSNNSWGYEMDINEQTIKSMADKASELGIEALCVDAGWFGTVGYWFPDEEKFPTGMRALSDYIENLGMKSGIWLAWSNGGDNFLNDSTLSVFNPKYSNWFGKDYPKDWQNPWAWRGACACLSFAPVYEWSLNHCERMITDYGFDLIKHDQRLLLEECKHGGGNSIHPHSKNPGDISWQCCQNYYRFHESLMEKYPDVLLENCVGGGCMVDFGSISRAHYTSANDHYAPLSLRQAFYDASYILPPRIIEGYLQKETYPGTEQLKYNLRSAGMGWCTIMFDLNLLTAEEQKVFKEFAGFYKNTMRPYIREANTYHISERPKADGMDAMMFLMPDGKHGIILAFRADSNEDELTVKPKGIEATAQYTVRCEEGYGAEGTYSGKELLNKGLLITFPMKQSSEVIFLDQKPN